MTPEIKRIGELEEGRISTVYPDQFGYSTIGIGRLVDIRKGSGLRDSEMDLLFSNDVQDREVWLLTTYPWMSKLSRVRLDAVILMAFQLGKTGFATFTGTLHSLQIGDWKGAANGMRTSKWATQTPARVARLAKQVETDTYQFKGT